MHCKGTGDSTEHEASELGNKDTTALRTVGAELTKEQRSSTSHSSDRNSGRQRKSKPAQQMTTDGTSARSAHKGPKEQTAATWRCITRTRKNAGA